MAKKKSKDATEEDISVKRGKKGKRGKKEKMPRLTPEEKAIKNKEKVEKQSAVTIKKAQDRVKKAEQQIKNREKSVAKKEKDKEKKEANKVKAEERKIEKKAKKKAETREIRTENKIRRQEQKIEERAERAQHRAELAARSPIQKKIDRRSKFRKFLIILLLLVAFAGLVFAGIRYAPKLLEKVDLPEINISQTIDNIKAKIPFLNKEKEKEKEKEAEKEAEKEKKAKEPPVEEVPDDPTLYISGTSVLEPFYTEALAKFLGVKKGDIKEQSIVSDANDSYTNLINGDQQIVFGALPTEKEDKMAELAGVDLQPVPILNGGFVFFVHKDNPVKSLTKTQLYNIYSGTITNWKELGGKDEPIVALQRTEDSGAQTGMYKYVIDESEITKVEEDMKASKTKDMIKKVSSDTGAVGYAYYYYLDKEKNKDDVKMIAVNGVKADKKTISTAKYPLTTYSYAIIVTEENTKSLSDIISSVDNKIDSMRGEEAKAENATEDAVSAEPEKLPLKMEFIQWILSEEGQKLAEDKGFIRHDDR